MNQEVTDDRKSDGRIRKRMLYHNRGIQKINRGEKMKYRKIYEYIPYLESVIHTDDGFQWISTEDEKTIGCFPSMQLSGELDGFIAALYEEGIMNPEYAELYGSLYGDRNFKEILDDLESENADAITAVLSHIIRQNRFVEGLFVSCVRDGTILRLVRLLQTREG